MANNLRISKQDDEQQNQTGNGTSLYQPSDSVKQAQSMLEQQLAQKPGAYQSPWQSQLNDIIDKIQNREKFSYDLNGDALYQQYKNQYKLQGQQAMMDTMGQATALTGGYGNSYAQQAGQQAYHGYLQQLNDRVPELYQLALSRYQMEGNDLLNQYGMMNDREGQDYNRYRDQVGDWQTEADRLQDRYDAERDYDYGKYLDDRSFQYQLGRDEVSDQQWQAEFDEAKRQWEQQHGTGTSSGGGSGSGSGGNSGSGGSPGGGGDWDNGSLSEEQVKAMQKYLGVTADGKWGKESSKAIEGMSADEAWNVLGPEVVGSDDVTDNGNDDERTDDEPTGEPGKTVALSDLSKKARWFVSHIEDEQRMPGTVKTNTVTAPNGKAYQNKSQHILASIDRELKIGRIDDNVALELLAYYGMK